MIHEQDEEKSPFWWHLLFSFFVLSGRAWYVFYIDHYLPSKANVFSIQHSKDEKIFRDVLKTAACLLTVTSSRGHTF